MTKLIAKDKTIVRFVKSYPQSKYEDIFPAIIKINGPDKGTFNTHVEVQKLMKLNFIKCTGCPAHNEGVISAITLSWNCNLRINNELNLDQN